jgi:protoheme IX farnesyltransferase
MRQGQRSGVAGFRHGLDWALPVLLAAAAVVTYALVVIGGVVRVSGSGLGCPDWPLCHGHLLPPWNVHAIIEYSHRTAAFLAGTLIVVGGGVAWLAARRSAGVKIAASLTVLLLIVQITLGAITVLLQLPPIIVLAHLATAQALLGCACVAATLALLPHGAAASDRRALRAGRLAAAAAYLLILSGSLVVGSRASGSCSAWPLCGNGFALPAERLPWIELLHRGLAAVLGVCILAALWVVLRQLGRARPVRLVIALTTAAFVFQVAVGAAVVVLRLPAVLRGLHLALATAVWVGCVVLSVLAARLPAEAEAVADATPPRSWRRPLPEVVADYVSLAKPRIIVLLLITALGAMMIAARGWPSTGLVVLTLLGGALAAAGAGAINCWIDRDIDRTMLRTRRRPLPDGRIAPAHALLFGITLGALAFCILAFFVNVLAATLAISGLLFYVLVYTLWLKRSTAQNIVIGGAAGAVPPLVGWAAVTHSLDLTALSLFAIIFFWTPPHFWSLALRLKADYARAAVPMLPVKAGDAAARRQILAYTIILVAVSVVAVVVTHALGALYLGGALVLGAIFIGFALLNLFDRRRRWSRPLFDYSIAYLAILFAIMVVDRVTG